ncbi:hypothetical protein NPIL_500501 [Nephila pilipes]|uniref:Uncharacterized protein n=1 Tax=Nephila pilipes TaxID=299642 RepID=A0A8X6PJA4_NEPPI|nr:hypothetical protein NPIL_500501 [Nephila pilipes]
MVDTSLKMVELNQKFLNGRQFLEDKKFVRDVSATTIESRATEGEKNREERRLEREREMELTRMQATRGNENRSLLPREHNNGEGKERKARQLAIKLETEASFQRELEEKRKTEKSKKIKRGRLEAIS